MPKSFLVKKKLKLKICSSDSEDENDRRKQEERNAYMDEDKCSLWKPYEIENKKTNEATRQAKTRSGCTPVEPATKPENIEKPKLIQPSAPKRITDLPTKMYWRNINLPCYDKEPSSEIQSPEAKQQCNRCQRTYNSDAALLKHQRYYCNFFQTKSFTCKYCDKAYLSLGALKMHIRTHTLPCTCMICGKAFSRPWLLQGHIRTHTGEKPYECTKCNRAFADRSNLRAHLQTHSQIKKYKCERCERTFSRMSLLVKHQTSTGCSVPRH